MHPLLRPWLAQLSALLCVLPASAVLAAGFSTNANRLAYLDEDNPFYPHRDFPRLVTPQWVGEPGVEAVVILAIDDMRDSKKYETFLRPILDRLKKMDGRAPVSIFANVVEPADPQLQTWLREGLSLEVHTLTHPCPLLQRGSFTNAWNTYHGGVDLLNKVPGNKPVAFRMPCCDSMNSPSPRFYAEIFNRTSPNGNFLQADSSVMCLLTDDFLRKNGVTPPKPPEHPATSSPSPPSGERAGVRGQTPPSPKASPTSSVAPPPHPQSLSPGGGEGGPTRTAPDHFRRYFPSTTNALTKKSLANFGTYIEDYPYPYVINRTCWEFPAMVPSDWEAFNAHGPTNAATVADWQLALDAVVRAQGVFTFIFHPQGWIRADQLIQFIDHAERTHGKKVKFLTFKEAVERLNKNLLKSAPLRAEPRDKRDNQAGRMNGAFVADLGNDGFVDVVIEPKRSGGLPQLLRKVWNPESKGLTRIWKSTERRWMETETPSYLVGNAEGSYVVESRWGILEQDRNACLLLRDRTYDTASLLLYRFATGRWNEVINPTAYGAAWRDLASVEATSLMSQNQDTGLRLRDFNRDGRCELLVSNDKQNALFAWSEAERAWKKLPYALPPGLALVNERGEDNGLRFVDLNGDGFDDLLLSNEKEYAIYLWARDVKPHLGWHAGWSHKVLHEQRPVAAGILPAVEGGVPPPGKKATNPPAPSVSTSASPASTPRPPGWEARLHGGQDAHRHEIPPFVRPGPHRNNGAWFHRNQLFVQNEDTAHLPDVVWRKPFSELIAFDMPAPKTPAESQQCFQVRPGFRVELVAAEPLVMSPVAFEWGADGKLWVVEMSDYPNGIPEHEARAASPSPPQSGGEGRGEEARPAGKQGSPLPNPLPARASQGEGAKAANPSPALQSPSPFVGRGERAGVRGGGRVKFLEDLDGDGRYDRATIFLDNLPFPTGVMPWRKGVLISAAPNILYAEDTDGDGKADVVKVLFTGFREGNQQHRVNGFELGLDNWIYGANGDSGGTITFVSTTASSPSPPSGERAGVRGQTPPSPKGSPTTSVAPPPHPQSLSPAGGEGGPLRTPVATTASQPSTFNSQPVSISGRDFRFRPDTGEFEAIEGQTQFGRRRDDWGNWFGNNNPNWLWHYWLPDRYLRRNPHLAVKSSKQMLANYPDSTRCFPISTPPIRFNQPQSVNHVTSGCSPAPYRDDLFGPGFATSVFISEPVHNLVHREVLVPDGVSFTSRRAPDEQDREFLASTDNWFRPTMLKTGPDGALYLADFYRFVLEHPEWIAPETQARLDLRAGADKGRIWRVVLENQPRRPVPNLAKLNTTQLIAALDSPSGWQRDTVQRLLVERQDKGAVKPLETLVKSAANPKVRVQALAVIEGLRQLDEAILIAALKDPAPNVREHAIRASEPLLRDSGGPRPPRAQVAAPSRQPPARADETKAPLAKNAAEPTARAPLAAPGAGALPEASALLRAFLPLVNDPSERVRQQYAFTLGQFEHPATGLALAKLATADYAKRGFREAILSSVPTASTHFFDLLLDEWHTGAELPKGLTDDVLNYVASVGNDDWLLMALVRAATFKTTTPPTPSQLNGLASLLDAMERRGKSLSALQKSPSTQMQVAVGQMAGLFLTARTTALSQSAIGNRQSAITLLGRGPSGRTEDLAALATLLKPQQPAEIQTAAVAQLAKLGGSDSASALLADWRAHSPALREAVLSALLSRPAWIDTLLAAVERGQVAPTQISPAQRQKLTTHPQAALRDRATKLFAATSADRAKVIKDYAAVATLTGSATRGRELFTKNCGVCHKLKGEGREIGPDLAMTATRDTDWLLTAILDPNAAVEARYLGYTAETKSGREFTGIITAETPNNLVLRGADGTEETILRTDLKQLLGSGLSLMPEGMESALKPQDMADLLAFIRAK